MSSIKVDKKFEAVTRADVEALNKALSVGTGSYSAEHRLKGGGALRIEDWADVEASVKKIDFEAMKTFLERGRKPKEEEDAAPKDEYDSIVEELEGL